MYFEGKVSLTEKEVAQVLSRVPANRRARLMATAGAIAAPIVTLIAFGSSSYTMMLVALGGVPIMLWQRISTRRAARRSLASWGSALVRQRVDDVGVFTETGNASGQLKWDGISSYVLFESFALLEHSNNCYDALFLQAFTPDERTAILKVLEQKLRRNSSESARAMRPLLLWVTLLLFFLAVWKLNAPTPAADRQATPPSSDPRP